VARRQQDDDPADRAFVAPGYVYHCNVQPVGWQFAAPAPRCRAVALGAAD